MRKTTNTSTLGYKWIERNITKHGSTYRVKVGGTQTYVATREKARQLKRQLLSK